MDGNTSLHTNYALVHGMHRCEWSMACIGVQKLANNKIHCHFLADVFIYNCSGCSKTCIFGCGIYAKIFSMPHVK